MKHLLLVVGLSVLACPILPAQAEPANEPVSEELNFLTHADDEAYVAYQKNYADGLAWPRYIEINAKIIPRVMELIRQDPEWPASFTALGWIVMNDKLHQGTREKPALRSYEAQVIALLRDHQVMNPAVGRICWEIGRNWSSRYDLPENSEEFIRAVVEKNPDRITRGQATYALAYLLKERAQLLEEYENAPPPAISSPIVEKIHALCREQEKQGNSSQTVYRQSVQLFSEVIEKYADCATGDTDKSTCGEKAKLEVYEINHLSVGQVAPEIEGESIACIKFKLSDYRGKIVVVSFWGSWCGPCMALVPTERALVERMAGKSFVLVGVNSDETQEKAKQAMEKEKMSWPSFWNGPAGKDGPISKAWNVRGWPTVFILDQHGVIRLKLIGFGPFIPGQLNGEIDRLLAIGQ